MKRKLRDAGLLSLLIFLLFACKPDKLPDDICANEPQINQDFKMYLLVRQPGNGEWVDTLYLPNDIDTIYMQSARGGISHDIIFEADATNLDSIRWKVGYDVRTFTQPKFLLPFREATEPISDVTVRMLRYRRVWKPCFPNDDGKDTIRKTFYLANANVVTVPQLGHFKGHIMGQERDTFVVEVKYLRNVKSYVLDNFPKNARIKDPSVPDPDSTGVLVSFVGNYLFFESTYAFARINQSGLLHAIGKVENGILTFDYQFRDGTKQRFVGVKQ